LADLDAWNARLAGLEKSMAMGLRKALISAALIAEAEAKKNATRNPKVRSGRLRASIRAEVQGLTMSLKAGGTRNVRYAAQREFGGTIRPVRARWLTIPLPNALTGAGVPRFPGPRSVPGLFTVRSRAGNLVMMRKTANGVEPMYVLKDSVTQKAQPYLRPAVAVAVKKLGPVLADVVATAVLP
jgi:hypothetical protein